MGGDRGPGVVVAGMAKSAAKNPDLRYIVHGPEAELRRLIERRRGLSERCEIRDAPGVVRMDERPSHVMRHGKGTSMWSAIEAVRGRGAPSASPAATPAR
jgi:glycerol-3-phosphate acyltransferase PlsX